MKMEVIDLRREIGELRLEMNILSKTNHNKKNKKMS